MAQIHRHADGSFWFATATVLDEYDRKELSEQSPGFSSQAAFSRDVTEALANERISVEKHMAVNAEASSGEFTDIVIDTAALTPVGAEMASLFQPVPARAFTLPHDKKA